VFKVPKVAVLPAPLLAVKHKHPSLVPEFGRAHGNEVLRKRVVEIEGFK
jgi:hypothetical protein